MLIKKNNLVIRNAKREDSSYLYQWWNDGKIMEHAGFPNGLGISIEKICLEIAADTEEYQRLIIEIDGIPVGEMSYRIYDSEVGEIGIKICDFTKIEKGYGTELLKMLIDYLFKEKNCKKVILDTNIKNTRAQHVYEKIGFKKVRTNVDSWKNQLGELQTSIDYEMSSSEFEQC